MQTITAKIPDDLHVKLEKIAELTDRKKSYLVRKAIAEYLEDIEDYYDGLAVLAEGNKTIPFSEVMRECGLDD